ncbi:MAG: hypothetical protein ACJATT_004496 [Myxococcota bacterium]|jgi:hypothetical protein
MGRAMFGTAQPLPPIRFWATLTLLLAGCPRASTNDRPSTTASNAETLQWAMRPGDVLSYDVTLQTVDDSTSSTWTFLVDDVGEMESSVSGFNDDVSETQLQVRPDGRLRSDTDDFAVALTERAIWCALPRRPVQMGDEWDAAQIARPFLDLMPSGHGERLQSTATLVSLTRRQGTLTAIIDTETSVSLAGRRVLDIRGRTTFNATAGRLVAQDLHARFIGESGPDTLDVVVRSVDGLGSGLGGRP